MLEVETTRHSPDLFDDVEVPRSGEVTPALSLDGQQQLVGAGEAEGLKQQQQERESSGGSTTITASGSGGGTSSSDGKPVHKKKKKGSKKKVIVDSRPYLGALQSDTLYNHDACDV